MISYKKTILVASVVIICLFTNSQAFAQDVIISNVETNPSTLHVGDSFRINATIVNNSPSVIKFNGGCQSPLSAIFDKNVSISQAMGCFAIFNVILKPGQNVTVVGPNSENTYTATSSGITNANITFTYYVGNQTQNTISRIQSFDILEKESIPEFPTWIGVIFTLTMISAIVITKKAVV